MPENYVLLERTELNASAASVTFANIPQTGYTDLKIVLSTRGDVASVQTATVMKLNALTSGYADKYIFGSGSSAGSGSFGASSGFIGDAPAASATANTFGNQEVYLPNYASNVAKSWSVDSVAETNATTAYMELTAGYNSTTSAITAITFTPSSGNYVAGSTFSLYGIAALGTTPAIAPKADGGNRIDNDGTYWYHTFTSSGTFTPQVGLTADVLVVAGGGGGGAGCGGGAGGFRNLNSQSLPINNYAVIVGSGGTAGTIGGANPTAGINSSIIAGAISISSSGGGGGGIGSPVTAGSNGGAGGSGGGGSFSSGATTVGGAGNTGSYSPVEGYAGGGNGGFTGSAYPGGGGGGAGAVGQTAPNTNQGGAGGAGSNALSSWASVTSTGVSGYYAGGGGGGAYLSATGGAGGSGGGGAGNTGISGGVGGTGTINTGSGGGASGGTGSGGSGGSGIIIVRYPIA